MPGQQLQTADERQSLASLNTELSWSMAGAMERSARSSSISPLCASAPTALQCHPTHAVRSEALCGALMNPEKGYQVNLVNTLGHGDARRPTYCENHSNMKNGQHAGEATL